MKFMKKMREVQHGSASFWYTDNDVCEDIDIDDKHIALYKRILPIL